MFFARFRKRLFTCGLGRNVPRISARASAMQDARTGLGK